MKKLLLKSGHTVLLDEEDFEKFSKFQWHIRRHKTVDYAVRRVFLDGKKKVVYLHREVMELKEKDLFVDHANHDGLDNRKSNLRVCSPLENNRNLRIRSDNSSGAKGVGFHVNKGKWRARIAVEGTRIFLGYFDSKEKASRAYNRAAQKYFGQFAY